MKTIDEISAELKISRTKLHRAAKRYPEQFRFAARDRGEIELIAARLDKRLPLTVGHLRFLLRNPLALESLNARQSEAVQAELQNLVFDPGDAIQPEQMPHVLITNAARRDPAAIQALATFIATAIPPSGCSYAFIAVRIAYHVPDAVFPLCYAELSRAIRFARDHEALAGCSDTQSGATRFFPRKIPFDL